MLYIIYLTNIILLSATIYQEWRAIKKQQQTIGESYGARLVNISVWAAILGFSVLGLFSPQEFFPIILFQIVYKTIWIIIFFSFRDGRGQKGGADGLLVKFSSLLMMYIPLSVGYWVLV